MIFAKCHPTEPHIAKGLCNSCYCAKRYREIPEKRQRANFESKRLRELDPAGSRYKVTNSCAKRNGYALIAMTIDEFRKWYNNHDKKICDCCYKSFCKRGHFVDHNHQTGEVRGMLCFRCNVTMAGIDLNGYEPYQNYMDKYG